MKSTGVVRRIDDLGRIVIPKEIRRTLRIRIGEILEITADEASGEVILKKKSPVQFESYAKDYAEAMFESTGVVTMIANRTDIVAVFGVSKKDYLDKQIGTAVANCLEDKNTLLQTNQASYEIVEGSTEDYHASVIAPVLLGDESVGAVLMLGKDAGVKIGDAEVKLTETAARFLAKHVTH
jgi:AbrB family transcriptional regulator (stage V sporulation protein T)